MKKILIALVLVFGTAFAANASAHEAVSFGFSIGSHGDRVYFGVTDHHNHYSHRRHHREYRHYNRGHRHYDPHRKVWYGKSRHHYRDRGHHRGHDRHRKDHYRDRRHH